MLCVVRDISQREMSEDGVEITESGPLAVAGSGTRLAPLQLIGHQLLARCPTASSELKSGSFQAAATAATSPGSKSQHPSLIGAAASQSLQGPLDSSAVHMCVHAFIAARRATLTQAEAGNGSGNRGQAEACSTVERDPRSGASEMLHLKRPKAARH